jgi:hypothetical protein
LGEDKHGKARMWDDWKSLAKRKGYACSVCTRIPEFDHRDIYFKTGKCAACASPEPAIGQALAGTAVKSSRRPRRKKD